VEGLKPTTQILLVPEFSSATEPQISPVTPDGNFQFMNLAPGDYSLYAFVKLDDIEYSNPQVLRGYNLGAKVRVTAREHQEVRIGRLAQ